MSDDGDLGLYVRIGRVPNRAWRCIPRPLRPGAARRRCVLDAAAPLPDADDQAQVIDVEGLHAEHHCEEPLERFHVVLRGAGEAHEDESAPLRSEAGVPIDVELDLVWTTDGVPYAWRQASRYEIPCRVSGKVTVGREEIELSGPGQRDHSWGARDWWAVDWMWTPCTWTTAPTPTPWGSRRCLAMASATCRRAAS